MPSFFSVEMGGVLQTFYCPGWPGAVMLPNICLLHSWDDRHLSFPASLPSLFLNQFHGY
jgi:hypothetical protein